MALVNDVGAVDVQKYLQNFAVIGPVAEQILHKFVALSRIRMSVDIALKHSGEIAVALPG